MIYSLVLKGCIARPEGVVSDLPGVVAALLLGCKPLHRGWGCQLLPGKVILLSYRLWPGRGCLLCCRGALSGRICR